MQEGKKIMAHKRGKGTVIRNYIQQISPKLTNILKERHKEKNERSHQTEDTEALLSGDMQLRERKTALASVCAVKDATMWTPNREWSVRSCSWVKCFHPLLFRGA